MRTPLIVLTAITACSTAFAQSSMALYGVVDASLESVRGDHAVTRILSGNLAGSRLGIKGVEDIGEGLRASFQLETPVTLDTGASGTGQFWGRQAWIGLSGGFGEVRLGRTDSLIGEITGSVLSAQAYDDLTIVGSRAGDKARRVSNAVTYLIPSLQPGLTVGLQYTTAGGTELGASDEAPDTDAGKSVGLSIKYASGPLSTGIGYLHITDQVSDTPANAALAYAGYDFGAVKITAYYNAESTPLAYIATGNRRLSVTGIKVDLPMSPTFMMVATASIARNVNGDAASTDNVTITTVKGIYNLTKRTAAYAMITNVNNGATTNKNIVGVTTSNDQTGHGIACGMRHMF